MEKNWKYHLGLALFIYSWIPYVVSGFIFFFHVSLGKLIAIIGAFLASAEIAFAISVVLLGKPFISMLKGRAKGFFVRHKDPGPPKPVGRRRHFVGVCLVLLSFLPYFLSEVALFYEYPKTDLGYEVMLLLMLLGDAMFIGGLFTLGGDFWDKLKKLFQYPPETASP